MRDNYRRDIIEATFLYATLLTRHNFMRHYCMRDIYGRDIIDATFMYATLLTRHFDVIPYFIFMS